MSDLAHLKIWDDPAIRNSLSWYLDVAENRRPAKFRIAATVVTPIDPAAASENALWAELDRLIPIFLERLAGNLRGRTVAGNGGWAESAGSLPRACLSHARPLQFLSVELPRRPDGRGEVRRLQTRLGFAGQLVFPSHW